MTTMIAINESCMRALVFIVSPREEDYKVADDQDYDGQTEEVVNWF
jgi:hypothetical protein